MGKKVKEYKAGDFIFAKVKGYPAWPARVQRPNGKKYFVYFYGTGETANLPPNQIFDYAENKDKFLTKTIKRKDFNDGARQIEHDFANNVPLEEVIGVPVDVPEEPLDSSANDTANDSTVNDSALETTAAADTTAADTTVPNETNATQNDTVEDSDEGALVIDEGKKGKKSTVKAAATPKPVKEPKTPRGKPKKDDAGAREKDDAAEGDGEKEEELVSRSGRKIRPKRYIDEQTEENATLPSPATKKRRGASPTNEKEKEKPKNTDATPAEKTTKQFNAISQVELEDLKEPFQPGEESSQDAKKNKTKLVPIFRKKHNNVPSRTSKSKFQPPIKAAKVEKTFRPPVKNIQDLKNPLENAHGEQNVPSTSQETAKESEVVSTNTFLVEETFSATENPYEKLTDTQLSSLDKTFTQQRTENLSSHYYKENVASVRKVIPMKSKGSFSLGNVIFGSLNLINDDELLLSQSLSQSSDKNPLQSLSQAKNVESFCSVASLSKTYKDLDVKSFENAKTVQENSLFEDFAQPMLHSEAKLSETTHDELKIICPYKIPHGENFLKLFQDCKGNSVNMDKYIPMSILHGDIGPNRNYSDWIKEKMGQEVPDDEEEDKDQNNILIAYLPSGQYVGVKLFQQRPTSFKSDSARLQWHKQSAAHSVTLKQQLERGHITAQSVITQLEMDLNLTDEEKANLDKEREIEEKKSRVQFLKTEMKLIELDAKIKSCLSLEKADTDLCLKLLDELMELDIKCLMLLKHPTCLETVKRMRAYVGNTPSWEMSETDALTFSKQASLIRKRADAAYRKLKNLFSPPEGLSFWEFFSERVVIFKKCTAHLTSDERLEMVHQPLEMTMPTSHTMKASIESANEEVAPDLDDAPPKKLKATPAKSKKAAASTPVKPSAKRQSSRSKLAEASKDEGKTVEEDDKEKSDEPPTKRQSRSKQPEAAKEASKPVENEEKETTDTAEKENAKEPEPEKEKPDDNKSSEESQKDVPVAEKEKDKETPSKNDSTEPAKDTAPVAEKEDGVTEKPAEGNDKTNKEQTIDENGDDTPNAKEVAEKESEKPKEDGDDKAVEKEGEKEKKTEKAEKEKEDASEPRAKRGRESNRKTEPPPRSPVKRKSRS